MDKVLVINGSARDKSDTKSFIDKAFAKTDHKCIDLRELHIEHYNYKGKYTSKDEFQEIVDKLMEYDRIVFATPVYWYSMSGLMKVLFDRLTDLVTHSKEAGRKLKGKRIFLLAVGTDEYLPEGFEVPFRLTAMYLDMKYKASIYHSTKHSRPAIEIIDSIRTFTREIKKEY